MTYEIRTNAHFNSKEIYFDGKPSESIREALKSMRFRWHSIKRCWYGFADEDSIASVIESKDSETDHKEKDGKTGHKKEEKVNKFGVKVGDIFHASWGYEQTNNDFFQVVALVGETSVRVREVRPTLESSSPVSSMSEDRTVKISRELLPALDRSTFIEDQEKGDLKRLKSYAADGISNPQFCLCSFADAHYCSGDTVTVYESWYA